MARVRALELAALIGPEALEAVRQAADPAAELEAVKARAREEN